MIRISGPNRTGGVQANGGIRRTDAGASGFAPATTGPQTRAASPMPAGSLSGLDALLALQAVEPDAPRRRRKALRSGHQMLDVLEEIKIGLLSGQLSAEALDRVAGLLGGLEASGDPELDALIDDIALRAEVELAKLGRFVDRGGPGSVHIDKVP